MQLRCERDLFEIPEGVTYLNTAYNSPLLRASRQALEVEVGKKSQPWLRTADDFFANADRLRDLAAELFGGTSDDYAIVPAASYGLATAARALQPELKSGDVILLLQAEFPSNVYAWRRLADETGAVLETLETPRDGDWTSAILERLGKGVRIAALPACHWTNGAPLELLEISRACRAADVRLVLDVTQSLGAVPIDLDEIDPDFAVAAGYKWLLCPYGVGFLYVSPRCQHSRPLEESWLVRRAAEDFAGLVNYQTDYRPGARKFDVGETCTALLPGAIEALTQLQRWSVKSISASLEAINSQIATGLAELGIDAPERLRRSPHMFGVRLPDHAPEDLIAQLRSRDVHVSRRGYSMRIAPHLHVTSKDIERLVAALGELLR